MKNKFTPLKLVMACSLALNLMACNDDRNTEIVKPSIPSGLGFEQIVGIPDVDYPLPVLENLGLNSGNNRFRRDKNPITTILIGINNIWKGTTDKWQTTAGDYTEADNGYKAGDGPNPHNAANGEASDYVTEGTEIINTDTWVTNIQYVIDVTKNRTLDEVYFAFVDDVRSKNYSTIDGYGPLTEDYATNSGAYTDFQPILLTDVTENTLYKPSNNDDYGKYGGQSDSTLGDMVALARLFRNSAASTSGPKYVYGTPRPWRMTETGTIDFQEVETLICINGSSDTRETAEYRIDKYTSSVEVIPGLICGRRGHSTSKEAKLLYSSTTENRRKDNGYPSGHTNAGILSSIANAYALPERFIEQIVRGSDLGENRIIAGMHSPIDVIGGRIQATSIAATALNTNPIIAAAALRQSREYFGVKANSAGLNLYDYAHKLVEEGSFENEDGTLNVNVFNNNRYNDHDVIKANYLTRMTYGLPQTGSLDLDPIVPEGAEALLASRQPYLSIAQRRAVLATTEVESGYPILDGSNGWGRINLVAASDGYGAFEGDVNLYMDASQGYFSVLDRWRNNISGTGLLTKMGTGELVLTGSNTYSGGTLLKEGTLKAESVSAFGSGDLYIQAGTVEVDVDGTLELGGSFTMDSGTLSIIMDNDDSQMTVAETVYIQGGALELEFLTPPTSGAEFTLITGTDFKGEFNSIYASGYNVIVTYTSTNAIVTIK